MFHFKVIESGVLRKDVFKQFFKLREYPIADCQDHISKSLLFPSVHLEGPVKGIVGLHNFQIGVKHQQWFTNRTQDVIKNIYKDFVLSLSYPNSFFRCLFNFFKKFGYFAFGRIRRFHLVFYELGEIKNGGRQDH